MIRNRNVTGFSSIKFVQVTTSSYTARRRLLGRISSDAGRRDVDWLREGLHRRSEPGPAARCAAAGWLQEDLRGPHQRRQGGATGFVSGTGGGPYRRRAGGALRFLFNAMAPKPYMPDFPFQGRPQLLYLDSGPVAKSRVFQGVMDALGVAWQTHLPAGKDGRRVTTRACPQGTRKRLGQGRATVPHRQGDAGDPLSLPPAAERGRSQSLAAAAPAQLQPPTAPQRAPFPAGRLGGAAVAAGRLLRDRPP